MFLIYPVFAYDMAAQSATYGVNDPAKPLNGIATAADGAPILYQWYESNDGNNWEPIAYEHNTTYTPSTETESPGETIKYYRVIAMKQSLGLLPSNDLYPSDTLYPRSAGQGGVTQTISTTATIKVYAAAAPTITAQPQNATYIENDESNALTFAATVQYGEITYQWQSGIKSLTTGNWTWENIQNATNVRYFPPTNTAGTFYYRCMVTNTVNDTSEVTYTNSAEISIVAAQIPVFDSPLVSATYDTAALATPLNGTASVTDGGTITYQWYHSTSQNGPWGVIYGATGPKYSPPTSVPGIKWYRVLATNTLHNSSRSLYNGPAQITINNTKLTAQEKFAAYVTAVQQPFIKLCRLRFLQPDGTTAFAIDNDPKNKKSKTFIQTGDLSVNLQNGQRRQASLTLANINNEYDYNINNIWFGQEIALDEGLILPDGEDYYLPQGIFLIKNPSEALMPNQREVDYNLVDKWANLDGTLFGNLETTYQVDVNTNIFSAMQSVLNLDKGNGYQKVDNIVPVFTDYYNNMSQTLPDGTFVSFVLSPYTLTVDNDNGTYADIELGLAEMLNAWIGYDSTGRLRVDPSQDDILDITKPILWQFTMNKTQFLGATYTINNADVYNDYIIVGEALDGYPQPGARAVNMDARSDTNIYTSLGRRTKRETASGYYTQTQCKDLAVWKLKRQSVLQKSVSISCSQLFHIQENCLVTIEREDKPGFPIERHLIQGFSRPLATTGNMTISAISVNDFVEATVETWPPST